MASHYYIPISILLSLACLVSFAQSYNNGGVTLDLIHRDASLSPSHDPSKTRFERLRNAFDRSFSRQSSLSLTSSKSKSLDNAKAPLRADGGEFLIEYQIGTPPVRQLSIADTGSDLTWIQCKPCTQCYKQDYPLFNPASTKSYRPVACRTNQCALGGDTTCGKGNKCQYQVSYGDQSFSQGQLASERLTLGPNASFTNFVFGCGNNNGGTFAANGSGIFGLGNGAVSIVNQQASTIRGRFSYCLTSIDSNVSSKISFGSDAVVAGPNVVSTPLVKKDPATFYYLTLEGLSVGKKKIEYKPSSSPNLQSSNEGNIIIDSGTTLTFVPQELYDGIESSLKKAIKGKRVTDPQGTFGLCYELASLGKSFASPPVTAHFKGADVVLAQGSLFLEVEKGVACLTLVPSDSLAIFGNLHQAGYLIGYDLVKKTVNFLRTDCEKRR